MINLSTPNEELLQELNADYGKLGYWMKKKIGGEKGASGRLFQQIEKSTV